MQLIPTLSPAWTVVLVAAQEIAGGLGAGGGGGGGGAI